MLDEGKNQIGGMVAIAGSVMYFFTLKLPKQRTHFLVLFILTLLLLVLIRARSDCFALLACALFLSVKDIHWEWRPSLKNILTILGILLIAYIIYVGFISDELTRFMVGGKSSSDLDVLTSNRWERNQKGLEFLLKDPLLGEQEESSGILIIHNYILLRMVRYGIWSFPLVAFYLYFGIRTIVALFRERWTALRDVGFVACTIPLMVSFVEPNFPYGPGSVQMMAFLLLGATFRQYQQAPAHDAHGNTVLHISNDFTYSKVHTELYQHLDQEGVQQIVYTPIRNESLTGQNAFEGEHTRIIYSFILKPLHRLFFNRKIDKIGKDIAKQVDLDDVACVHATNLFSDGAAALWLKRHYGIPYIVAVRNSDLNAFLKYTPHLWWVHRAVIREAEKVVFITPMLQQRLTNSITCCLRRPHRTHHPRGLYEAQYKKRILVTYYKSTYYGIPFQNKPSISLPADVLVARMECAHSVSDLPSSEIESRQPANLGRKDPMDETQLLQGQRVSEAMRRQVPCTRIREGLRTGAYPESAD